MIPENFVIVGAVISFFGSLSYLIDTVRGRVKPNRVSFLMWALAPLVAFYAQIKSGVGIQSLMTLMVGLSPLFIFFASFVNKKSHWKLTKFDLVCGSLSFFGFILYLITKDAVLAVVFSIIADGLAAVPTVVKSYYNPETESSVPYLTAAISAAITLLTLTNWSFIYSGFSIYILSVCVIIYALVQFKLGKVISKTFNPKYSSPAS